MKQGNGDHYELDWRAIEVIIFNSRWLLVPFLLGMVVGLAALLYMFIIRLGELLARVGVAAEEELLASLNSWIYHLSLILW